jgi:hypothetical protein
MVEDTTEDLSPRRRWVAIGLATIPLFASYSMFLYGVVLSGTGEGDPTAWYGLGLFFVPFAYITLAFTSRHPSAPRAVLKSLGLWLVVALPLGFINVAVGMSAGFGFAGIPSLRSGEAHSPWVRAGAVTLGAVYIVVLLLLVPPIGAFAGGVVPFIALGLGDMYSEHRAAGTGSTG